LYYEQSAKYVDLKTHLIQCLDLLGAAYALHIMLTVRVSSVFTIHPTVKHFLCRYCPQNGPKAGMALVGQADANRHALLNTRKLPVYSTCRLFQLTQTLNLLVVVQGQCTMGCAADEIGMKGGFSAP
jgi:hypothetical protein